MQKLQLKFNDKVLKFKKGLEDSLTKDTNEQKSSSKNGKIGMWVESHTELLSCEITANSTLDFPKHGQNNSACTSIENEMKASDQRNVDSALKSLELSMQQCDEVITHKINASAEAVEKLIPLLENKIQLAKADMYNSHNSSQLIKSTVEENYMTMRDGYINLIAKMFSETGTQWQTMMKLQEHHVAWHLNKLNNIIDEKTTDPNFLLRKQAVFKNVDDVFQESCDVTFERLKESKMFEQKEESLQKLSNMNRNIFKWKTLAAADSEEQFNYAQTTMDAYYMTSIEEINDHLLSLHESLTQLMLYDRKLEQMLKLTMLRERQMDKIQEQQQQQQLSTTAVITSSYHQNPQQQQQLAQLGEEEEEKGDAAEEENKNGGCGINENSNQINQQPSNAEELVKIGQKMLMDMNTNKTLLMGTRIKALTQCCDLSHEEALELMEYILYHN